jgi:hypothetical protein
MAVSFIDSAIPNGNPTTSCTITIPTVDVDDDLYVAVTSRDHTAGTALPTCTDNDTGGNTWSLVGNSTDRKALLFRKKATSGTSGKSISISGAVGSVSAVLKVFRGGAAGDPTTNFAVETNASGDETDAGFTPSTADSMLCASIHNYANDNAVTSLASAQYGAMTMTEKLSTGGSDCATAFGHDLMSGSTATGNITWAQTNGTTYSIHWAIKPFVGVTPGLISNLGQVFAPVVGVTKFTDDFEAGNTNKWDTVVQSSGTITIDSRAHAGSFGMHIDEAAVAAGSGTYVRRSLLPSDTIRASGWFRQESEGPAGNNNANLRFFSGGVRIADLYRQNDSQSLWLRTRTNAGTSVFTRLTNDENAQSDVGTWYKLDCLIEYLGVGAVSHIQVWVNDVEVVNASDFDLDSGAFDAVQLGPEHPDQFMDTDYDDIRVNDPETTNNVSPGLIQQLGTLFAPQVNQQVRAALIDQSGVLFSPSVRQTVHPGLIQQLGAVFAPQQLGQQVRPGLINQSGVVFAPQVNQQVRMALIQQLGVVFGPRLNLWVHLGLINNSGAVFTPDVIADQFVTPGLVQSLGTVFSPQINQQVRVGLIQNLGVVFAFVVHQQVRPSLIQNLGIVFSPQVNQQVRAALITNLGVVFSPQLNQQVRLDLIQNLGLVFSPQLNQQVRLGLITSLGVTFEPVLSAGAGGQTVSPGLIDNSATIFSPEIDQQVRLGLITNSGVVFSPEIDQQVRLGLITNSGVVFSPEIDQQVRLGLISNLGVTFDPRVSMAVHPGLVQNLGVVFSPQLNQWVHLGQISQLGITFDPTIIAGVNNVFPGLINNLGSVFAPTLDQEILVFPDLITQLAQVFSPEIDQQVRLGLIPSETLVFTPSVGQSVSMGLITQTPLIFPPAFLETTVIAAGRIDNLGQVFDPLIISDQVVLVPLITQLGVVFVPLVRIGGLTKWLNQTPSWNRPRRNEKLMPSGFAITRRDEADS